MERLLETFVVGTAICFSSSRLNRTIWFLYIRLHSARITLFIPLGSPIFFSHRQEPLIRRMDEAFSLHFLNPFVYLDLSSSAFSSTTARSRPMDILGCLYLLESRTTRKQRSKNKRSLTRDRPTRLEWNGQLVEALSFEAGCHIFYQLCAL